MFAPPCARGRRIRVIQESKRRQAGTRANFLALHLYFKQEGASRTTHGLVTMRATIQTGIGDRSVHRHNDGSPSESQVSLQQALRTLRAIRQRYETGRSTSSDYARSYSVQIALGYADMLWITAAIEALEKAVAANAN